MTRLRRAVREGARGANDMRFSADSGLPARRCAAPLAALIAFVGQTSAWAAEPASASATPLATVIVTGAPDDDASFAGAALDAADLTVRRAGTSDTARLLEDVPGVNVYGAGGISALPSIRGLADERLRVQIDGMDLMSACPNHMNSPLSYINPTRVDRIVVYAGVAPVSAGGDSIGGAIQVESTPPKFARAGEGLLAEGQIGAFYRSNGDVRGYNFGVALAGEHMRLSYDESNARSDNYHAGDSFKAPGLGGVIKGNWLDGDEVGSSNFRNSRNRDLGLALQFDDHLLQLNVSRQTVGFEGFPNQRMDMTGNRNTLVNLRYAGQYAWGELKARAFNQNTWHRMDMGPDRFDYGFGMPMDSRADTRGAEVQGSVALNERDTLRLGVDYQTYALDDWWPPVGMGGSMCCDDFWNVRDGERDRVGAFGEWEARWNDAWTTLLGLRADRVASDAGDVQGYSAMGMWAGDAALFNALDRKRTDHHVDVAALMRYAPDAVRTFEAGLARKTRSPSLYERYPWSTQAMAALMNNFVGDGNGYIGNPDLEPEVAHTLSVSGDWRAPEAGRWGIKASVHFTYVDDYIDARRCDFGQCGGTNPTRTGSFVLLQYANQSARLVGFDLSGHRLLGLLDGWGSFTAKGMLSYVRGENRDTGDNLYNIMPLNAKLTLEQRQGGWTNAAEVVAVAAKSKLSWVRNEMPTGGYALLNLRSGYEWKRLRVDLGIENVFDRFYLQPLGGAYLGQGMSMTTGGIPWGTVVPGRGRSFDVALNLRF